MATLLLDGSGVGIEASGSWGAAPPSCFPDRGLAGVGGFATGAGRWGSCCCFFLSLWANSRHRLLNGAALYLHVGVSAGGCSSWAASFWHLTLLLGFGLCALLGRATDWVRHLLDMMDWPGSRCAGLVGGGAGFS